jgi:hypothetical protein
VCTAAHAQPAHTCDIMAQDRQPGNQQPAAGQSHTISLLPLLAHPGGSTQSRDSTPKNTHLIAVAVSTHLVVKEGKPVRTAAPASQGGQHCLTLLSGIGCMCAAGQLCCDTLLIHSPVSLHPRSAQQERPQSTVRDTGVAGPCECCCCRVVNFVTKPSDHM